MYIHSIKLVNYKSIGDYNENEVIIEPKVTAVIGKNESGKSNILEGVSKIRFLSRNPAAFVAEYVNRQAESGVFNSFLITLKHNQEEIDKGAISDTQIYITKDLYEATGGIVYYFKNIVANHLNSLVELLKTISNNPFNLSGQDYNNYTSYLTEAQKEDKLDFYKIFGFITMCKNRANYVPQDNRQTFKNLLNDLQVAWETFIRAFPTFFYRSINKTLNSSYKYDEINNELNDANLNPNSLLRELVKIIGIPKEDFLSACQHGNII